MNNDLKATVGVCSEAGDKAVNEDSCGAEMPQDHLLATKGITAIIADGVSGAEDGKVASATCVNSFISDYYSAPDSWSVKTSGQKVLTALNRWLHGQGHKQYGSERGLVTTASILVIKSNTAHIFHIGDTRIYRLRGKDLECLTRDHRTRLAGDKEYLSRALGIELSIDIDYKHFPVEKNDVFILSTDGVHDFIDATLFAGKITEHADDLDRAARTIVDTALANKSHDNVSCLILRIDNLAQNQDAYFRQLTELPFPPPLSPGMKLDGYKILRELHASKRSECFLVLDEETGEKRVLKAPSINYEDDPAYIELFQHEEWVGRRIHNNHVLKLYPSKGKRQCLYHITEYIEGQTLRQWMTEHPLPSLTEARNIIEQIIIGLRPFHRLEMIHQDLKPENIMIDKHGTVKIIDFGSTKIAGIAEIATPVASVSILGTENYTAPEYIKGYIGTNRSDIFSLGVIAYEMLTGALPYKTGMTARRKLSRLDYVSALEHNADVAPWVDGALKKAVDIDPARRYESLSEFLGDLTQPNSDLTQTKFVPLVERNPVGFWRTTSILLALLNLVLLYHLMKTS